MTSILKEYLFVYESVDARENLAAHLSALRFDHVKKLVVQMLRTNLWFVNIHTVQVVVQCDT